ncbi:MAG: FG-GAP-like repeat-containing protein [Myxococcota bacterium]
MPRAEILDVDGDGFPAGDDCDDEDEAVHPGAAESCNDVDDDCDGTLDVLADCSWFGDIEAFEEADAQLTAVPVANRLRLLGDLDGDGAGEVGFVGGQSWPYTLFVVDGPRSGATTFADASPASITSASGTDWFSIRSAGDVNGDGLADLVVGPDYLDDGEGEPIGACHLLLGPFEGGIVASESAALTLVGESPQDGLGVQIETLSDIDGDGVPDFAVSAYQADNLHGVTYVVSGASTGEVQLADVSTRLVGRVWSGEQLAAGDFNGDGMDDLIVGEPSYPEIDYPEGGFYVLHSPFDGTIALEIDSDAIVRNLDSGYFATAMDTLGDVDGDGYDDLVASFRRLDVPASALIFRGPIESSGDPVALAWAGISNEGGRAPAEENIQSAGDVDGDGRTDVLLGSPARDEPEGAVYLFYGVTAGTHQLMDASAVFSGDPEHRVGWAFAGGDDLDGDGLDDVVISGWGEETSDLAFFYGR